jgi:DNA-directed RNA polymerase subunit alpha
VNYEVENMRVGKRTDYNKITLEVVTDGSITPEEAFKKAVAILVEQFSVLGEIEAIKEESEIKTKEAEIIEEKDSMGQEIDPLKIRVADLKNLSTRTLNVLEEAKLVKVKDIVKHSEEELRTFEGMGDKGIKEIKKAIGEFGITLKQ